VNLDNRVCVVDQRGAVRERKQTALEEIELRDAHVGVVEIERGESVVNAVNDGGVLRGNQDLHLQHDQIAMRERVVPFGALETRGQTRARNPLAHAAQFYRRPADEKRGMQGVVQVVRRAVVVNQPNADAIPLRVHVKQPARQSSHSVDPFS